MKPSIWASSAAVLTLSLGAAPVSPGLAGDIATPDPPSQGTPVSTQSKISERLQTAMADTSVSSYEVIIVLNVPKPDLSHVLGARKTSPTPEPGGASEEDAQNAVEDILSRSNAKIERHMTNASSILAIVDAAALQELAQSEHVLEIVENQKLR